MSKGERHIMNDKTNIHGIRQRDFNLPVEVRFEDMLSVASNSGYSAYIQACCINVFGHSKLDELTKSDMDRLIVEAEPIILDAIIQLRLLK